jgi:hypothetical protein
MNSDRLTSADWSNHGECCNAEGQKMRFTKKDLGSNGMKIEGKAFQNEEPKAMFSEMIKMDGYDDLQSSDPLPRLHCHLFYPPIHRRLTSRPRFGLSELRNSDIRGNVVDWLIVIDYQIRGDLGLIKLKMNPPSGEDFELLRKPAPELLPHFRCSMLARMFGYALE